MGYQTEIVTVKSAKKLHQCSWCAEKIEIGETYLKYRWYDSGDASTVKMHPECNTAMRELIALEGGHQIQFGIGDTPRGCLCGYDRYCERCLSRKTKSSNVETSAVIVPTQMDSVRAEK